MSEPIQQELFYISDAAKVLGCTEGALRARLERDQVPSEKFGHRRVISRSTIDAIKAGQFAAPPAQ
jgi:hypothetical protein